MLCKVTIVKKVLAPKVEFLMINIVYTQEQPTCKGADYVAIWEKTSLHCFLFWERNKHTTQQKYDCLILVFRIVAGPEGPHLVLVDLSQHCAYNLRKAFVYSNTLHNSLHHSLITSWYLEWMLLRVSTAVSLLKLCIALVVTIRIQYSNSNLKTKIIIIRKYFPTDVYTYVSDAS